MVARASHPRMSIMNHIHLHLILRTANVLFPQLRIWMSPIVWRTSVHALPAFVLQPSLKIRKKIFRVRNSFDCSCETMTMNYDCYIHRYVPAFGMRHRHAIKVHIGLRNFGIISHQRFPYNNKLTLECTSSIHSCSRSTHIRVQYSEIDGIAAANCMSAWGTADGRISAKCHSTTTRIVYSYVASAAAATEKAHRHKY